MIDRAGAHILIVDDDPMVRRMLRRCLEDEGYQISEATDGDGVREYLSQPLDLITLDLNLGSADGLTVAREIRQHSEVPIIMITGKGDMIDRIVGLEVGADDYIAKPFHVREVLARVRSVLRRSTARAPKPDTATPQPESGLAFNGYFLDPERRTLTGPDGPVALTTGEFDLLALFASNPNRVLNRDQIMDKLKGYEWAPLDRSIDNQIARLRKKIEVDPKNPTLLKTVRGAGYTFAPERSSR
ncbi:response regulator [Pelagibacterium limicola]|uniref:response regulator n=1 Tax=Pelagibacterium limicola TaxID=2791022 RepID=UPI0018AFAE14|nr:response regulator transcription factor [Pelagibacterium limicola]